MAAPELVVDAVVIVARANVSLSLVAEFPNVACERPTPSLLNCIASSILTSSRKVRLRRLPTGTKFASSILFKRALHLGKTLYVLMHPIEMLCAKGRN
jgi:hypothetical protein